MKFDNVYKEDLFIMKLLTTQPEFLEDVKIVREKLKMPRGGFKERGEKNRWLRKNLSSLPPGIEVLSHPRSLFYHAEALTKKYSMRYNFLPHIENFILFEEIDAPRYNFSVSTGPDPRGFRSEKWISIKAFAPLTKDEIRKATKKLLELQKEFLPPKVTLDLRPKLDIDKVLEIEKEMNNRIRKATERPDWYLEQVRKQYGESEFERVKKLNPGRIQREIEWYTGNEIAEKFFGTLKKAALVRQIYSRLQQKRKQLFG